MRPTHRPRHSPRLGAGRKLAFNVIAIGIWLSGAAWLVLHYLMRQQGEFGPQAHPLEPWALKGHGAFAFAAIWMAGMLWAAHVVNAWPQKRRRPSGIALLCLLIVLIVSGYLLYYAGDEELRSVISTVHRLRRRLSGEWRTDAI
jgi:Kef-type K+ transport system membrane component KefB